MVMVRADVWSRARALDELTTGGAYGACARRLARRLRPAALPLGFDQLIDTPIWASWSLERRRRLARIAGAVMSARTLQQIIDGRVLGVLGLAIGEAALDAVLSIPPQDTQAEAWSGEPTPDALEGLGASALLQELEPALARRLAIGMAEPSIRLSPAEAASVTAGALRIEVVE